MPSTVGELAVLCGLHGYLDRRYPLHYKKTHELSDIPRTDPQARYSGRRIFGRLEDKDCARAAMDETPGLANF